MSNPGAQNPARLLGQRLREMQEVSQELREAEEEAVAAAHKANVEEYKAFLRAEGAMDMRKVRSRLEVEELRFIADLAEQKVAYLRRSFRIADKRVDAGRTYSADLRAELKTLGMTPETST